MSNFKNMDKELENVASSPNEKQNWRSDQNNIVDQLNYVLANNIMSDITFLVGKNKESIKAHKLILSVGSNVFETMFNDLWDNSTTIIELSDIEVNAFNNMLKFLYTSEIELTLDSTIGVLYAARKYEILLLEEYCVKFLKTNLNTTNVFKIFSIARLFDISKLVIPCLKIIDIYTQECINSPNFTDIDHDTLEIILLRDTLMIKEIYLYEAIIKWSETKCVNNELATNRENQLSFLKNCAKLIRYPLMDLKEFATGPAEGDLLSLDEKFDYFKCQLLGSKPTFEYSNKPRFQTCEIICNRFEGSFNNPIFHDYSIIQTKHYAFGFEVNNFVFISGFGLYGGICDEEHVIKIALYTSSSINPIALQEVKVNLTNSLKYNRVKFDSPVLISPSITYYAIAVMYGPTGILQGIYEREKVICKIPDGDEVIFTFKPIPTFFEGYITDDQIPEIIFYA